MPDMTDPGNDTRLVDVKGRTIVVKQLKDAQLLLMRRDAARMMQDSVPNDEKVEAGGWILEAFESAIVQPDDHAYVLSLMRKGELELVDFLGFLSAFTETEPKKATVRRGRPPRKLA